MANWQNMLSGAGLYLLAIAMIYGRRQYYPTKFEKTQVVQTILKAEKRDKADKMYHLDESTAKREYLALVGSK